MKSRTTSGRPSSRSSNCSSNTSNRIGKGVAALTVIENLARWSAGLKIDEIPERVLEVARNQVLSVMGAIHAGAGCAGGKAVIETVKAMGVPGPCATYPGGASNPLI